MFTSYKFLVYFFNICGFLSVVISENKLKISKVLISLNLVLNPLCFLLKLFIPLSFYAENFNHATFNMAGASKFLIAIFNLMGLQIIITAFLCSYVSVWKLKSILGYIDNCVKVFYKFKLFENSENAEKFKRKCLKTFYFSVSCFICFKILLFFSMYKLRWQAFLMFILLHAEDNIAFFYILFISFFLFYFLFLLQNLNDGIETMKKSENTKDFENLLSKYLDIYRLIIDFNKTFGFLLSVMTASSISLITINVS